MTQPSPLAATFGAAICTRIQTVRTVCKRDFAELGNITNYNITFAELIFFVCKDMFKKTFDERKLQSAYILKLPKGNKND